MARIGRQGRSTPTQCLVPRTVRLQRLRNCSGSLAGTRATSWDVNCAGGLPCRYEIDLIVPRSLSGQLASRAKWLNSRSWFRVWKPRPPPLLP